MKLDHSPDDAPKPPKSAKGPMIGILVVLLLGGGGYYYWTQMKSAPSPSTASAPAGTGATAAAPNVAAPGGVPAPTPSFPIPSASPGADHPAPPPLDASDEAFAQELAKLLGAPNVARFFNSTDIIRRLVATTINAGAKALPSTLSPFKPLGSPFVAAPTSQAREVGNSDEAPRSELSESNFSRYSPMVKAIGAVDVTRAAAIYIRFYSLFQAAYADLGTPGYFNDHLVEAIDICLAAPDPKPPVSLVQPRMAYQFADPKLESLSAAQKILVRMGPENAIVLKEKLRQFRELIAHHGEGT